MAESETSQNSTAKESESNTRQPKKSVEYYSPVVQCSRLKILLSWKSGMTAIGSLKLGCCYFKAPPYLQDSWAVNAVK